MTGVRGKSISNVEILSTASAFPDGGKWLLNEDIHEIVHGKNWLKKMKSKGLDPDYFKNEYGFQKRYVVDYKNKEKSLTSADLMEAAGRKIISKSKIDKKNICLLIAVSTTTHRYTTSLGAIVSGRLGLKCASFEIKAGCASSVYAVLIASQFVRSTKGIVLIVSGETLSKVASESYLYAAGDGGAGILLGYSENTSSGIHSYYLDSDGYYSDSMGVPGILPPTKEALQKNEYLFQTSSNINSVIEEKWKKVPSVLYEQSHIKPKQIKAFIPHQVHNKLIEIGRLSARIEKKLVVNKVKDYGNCGQTSILIALNDAIQEKKILKGDYFMLCAVGGGLGWGGIIWKY